MLFERLQASLSSSWEHYFSEASIYYAEHGDLNVPKRYTTPGGLSLGVWLITQRRVREGQIQGDLTQQQIARLDSIGMVWGNRNDRQWNQGYQEAKRYFEAHGDLRVPVNYVSPEGYALGKWVKRQRYTRLNPEKSCGALTEERMERLDAIGMIWNKMGS